ncbi:TetR/AcrR family transcriptional regulator [Marinicella meishanensis]|uniref:TetR/AcrR family transcriptional regulator n=1 Tax=Marinicella meishanensis TaxID=2873263 RepID=UPI001CBDE979|nr:TetR/AcrR family transcriptional regulator [Marinicella sp. NBU2979]
MPYSKNHKAAVKQKITETARILFNRFGYEKVTIDQVMAMAGLTRGGFYNHFSSKEALFKAAVDGFLMGRGAQWREAAGIDPEQLDAAAARQMIDSYLSQAHLGDIEGQCPMIALPSDVARASTEVQQAYQRLLEAMVFLFEHSLSQQTKTPEAAANRQQALALAALCVGGMVLARTLPDSALAEEVQQAAHLMATTMTQ